MGGLVLHRGLRAVSPPARGRLLRLVRAPHVRPGADTGRVRGLPASAAPLDLRADPGIPPALAPVPPGALGGSLGSHRYPEDPSCPPWPARAGYGGSHACRHRHDGGPDSLPGAVSARPAGIPGRAGRPGGRRPVRDAGALAAAATCCRLFPGRSHPGDGLPDGVAAHQVVGRPGRMALHLWHVPAYQQVSSVIHLAQGADRYRARDGAWRGGARPCLLGTGGKLAGKPPAAARRLSGDPIRVLARGARAVPVRRPIAASRPPRRPCPAHPCAAHSTHRYDGEFTRRGDIRTPTMDN
jgi:hypothetical protein